MPNIYCTKCGLEAFGKCPKCRTIFPVLNQDNYSHRDCDHDWQYKASEERCIYGCGYKSPLIYAGQY